MSKLQYLKFVTLLGGVFGFIHESQSAVLIKRSHNSSLEGFWCRRPYKKLQSIRVTCLFFIFCWCMYFHLCYLFFHIKCFFIHVFTEGSLVSNGYKPHFYQLLVKLSWCVPFQRPNLLKLESLGSTHNLSVSV